MSKKPARPKFKRPAKVSAFATPEEMFSKLPGRAKTHGYLRGPQQDVLRDYAKLPAGTPNVALELPTGTGKTAVGLLLAEWHRRRSGRPVAYLTLTNQLARQVLVEGSRLGVNCADLTGPRDERDPAEEGRYLSGSAVAVTTYSNLFNINPVIRPSQMLVLDDAHGGEQHAANMWTVRISARRNRDLFDSALSAVRPALSDAQFRVITDPSEFRAVELCDVHSHPECLAALTPLLDESSDRNVRFSWPLLRNRLSACLFLLSRESIVIRPLVPPTHIHDSFSESTQRIFMSATLGNEGDLQRAYGVDSVKLLRAERPQWGRRYVFVPGLYVDEDTSLQIVARVWDQLATKRAVILAPSRRALDETYEALAAKVETAPIRMGAEDIEDSLDGFTGVDDAILALAGRYDGLDLPDEDCRLLIMSGSPAAIGELERHLSLRWKMGPVLRSRERTRLVQGMGRCTRNATDFAVILWLGGSLVDAVTSSSLIEGLPQEIKAEVTWGKEQVQVAPEDPDQLIGMVLGLLDDDRYRAEANADIDGLESAQLPPKLDVYDEAARAEVRYAAASWADDYDKAYKTARSIADHLDAPALSGYRAWWWYLASVAALFLRDKEAERDCLRRAVACGVNSGWIGHVLRTRLSAKEASVVDDAVDMNAEGVWDHITTWGWVGKKFSEEMGRMIANLGEREHYKKFHEGLDALGVCLGASATRRSEAGSPDVVWSFPGRLHIAFEAKTGKKSDSLSKYDVQQAKGHIDWVKMALSPHIPNPEVWSVIISPTSSLHSAAMPHANRIFCLSPDEVLQFAQRVADTLKSLRLKYAGHDFTVVAKEFAADLKSAALDTASVKQFLLKRELLGK